MINNRAQNLVEGNIVGANHLAKAIDHQLNVSKGMCKTYSKTKNRKELEKWQAIHKQIENILYISAMG